jgi:hypothetical protein
LKHLKHIRIFDYVHPGPRAAAYLESRSGRRHGCLSDLKVIDGICKWCEVAPIPKKGRYRFYCGHDCSESAYVTMNPQKPTAKAFLLLVRQEGSCARCKQSFADELDERILKKLTYWIPDLKKRPLKDDDTTTLFTVGVDTGHIWQVDHIHPIHKGGAGVGLDNVQVLCVPCHLRKTAEDRRKGVA